MYYGNCICFDLSGEFFFTGSARTENLVKRRRKAAMQNPDLKIIVAKCRPFHSIYTKAKLLSNTCEMTSHESLAKNIS